MSIKNWYPFYVGDYMRDTAQLSIIEHGAYRLLIDHYYSTGESLPDDEKQLYRICRAFDEQEQKAITKVLQLFFEHDVKAKVYTSKRIEKELEKKASISLKRSQAAKNKGKNKKANAKQMQSKCRAIDDTSTSTSTSTVTTTSKNIDSCQLAVDAYNDFADDNNLSKVQKFTSTRKSRLKKRLKDCGGIDGWKHALETASKSDFLMGRKTDWKIGFDFLLQESSFVKLMEGGYNNNKTKGNKNGKISKSEQADKELQQFLDRR
jgi:uncharacterized protein YdaU (DUF1376 family)